MPPRPTAPRHAVQFELTAEDEQHLATIVGALACEFGQPTRIRALRWALAVLAGRLLRREPVAPPPDA